MLGIIAAFLASCTWAFGVSVYADLSKKYPPSAINFTRSTIALPMFLIAFIFEKYFTNQEISVQGLNLNWPLVAWMFLSALCSYGLGDILFMKATQSPLKAAGALAIASIYPVWSALGAILFKNERLTFYALIGLLMVVGGSILIIVMSREEEKKLRNRYAMGIGVAVTLSFVTSIFWALNIFAASHAAGSSVFLMNAIRMFAALLLCPLFGFLLLRSKQILLEKEDIKKAFPVFIVEGFCGSLFYIYGLSHTSMALGGVLTSLAPILAVPIDALRHHEKPSFKKILTVFIVILGLWLLMNSR